MISRRLVSDQSGWWFGIGFALLLGVYANFLNQRLYRVSEPFFDSMGYYEQLYRVMMLSRTEGLSAGFAEILTGGSTTFLPMLFGSLWGLVAEPSRSVGIWIQVAELAIFFCSIDYALRMVWNWDRTRRLILIASLGTMSCLYFTNGGLSDFRMDLSLALMYATTAIWSQMAQHRPTWSSFAIVGFWAGVTCLFRATAPVYLGLGIGPIVLWEFASKHGERRGVVARWSLSVAVAIATCLWFYVIKFDHLYHYYFVWNTDANAKIPWLESLGHLKLVFRQLGWGYAIWIGAAFLLVLLERGKRANPNKAVNRLKSIPGDSTGHFRTRTNPVGGMVWLALAPLVLLIGRRMGLNPFVSMPTALVSAVVLAIVALRPYPSYPIGKRRGLLVCLGIALFVAAGRGFLKHEWPRSTLMQTHQEIIDSLVRHSRLEKRDALHYGTLQMVDIETSSLQSVILFDRIDVQRSGLAVKIDGVQLMPSRTFTLPAESDWGELPGVNDSEKVSYLVDHARNNLDYLIVPTNESMATGNWRSIPVTVHAHLREIYDGLRGDPRANWAKVAGPFDGQAGRRYEIWARSR